MTRGGPNRPRSGRRPCPRRPPGAPLLAAFLAIAGLSLPASTGCHSVRVREASLRNAFDQRRERSDAARGVSATSATVLARHGLLPAAEHDPAGAARALERYSSARPEPGGALALAELSYRAGLAEHLGSPDTAMAWYRDAAALASMALAEPGGSGHDAAIEVHNHSLERLIRLAKAEGKRKRLTWRRVLGDRGIAIGRADSFLAPERIAELRLVCDLQVTGMDNVYGWSGLGVPLVAHRMVDPSKADDPRVQFMAREVRAGATAVLMPGGGLAGGAWRRNPSTLLLFDPFLERTLSLGTREVALAGDRTTPLAMQVARGRYESLEWAGLLESDFRRPGVDTGIYMLRPYDPGKIPVLFVHGLVSSPRAFIQTINELENDPALSAKYQFWVFLYPTGLPIPSSALRLRQSLARVREKLDPARADPALDRMVLVGHSMGGLLGKMMVQDTGLKLWDATILVPFDEIQSLASLRDTIGAALVFRPMPCVRRVVFIATPHRGSPIADDLIGRTVSKMVRLPDEQAAIAAEMKALYGPDIVNPELHGRAINAIGNLRTDSPILSALDQIPIDPRVPHHSIIPLIGGGRMQTDGVVEYVSSHLEGAASERILDGTHFSQQKPEVTEELRRILMEHLSANDPAVTPAGGS